MFTVGKSVMLVDSTGVQHAGIMFTITKSVETAASSQHGGMLTVIKSVVAAAGAQ